MRARFSKIGQGDSLEAGYGLFDDDALVFSSGTPWFAFDTMDFRLIDGNIVEVSALPALRSQSRLETPTATAFLDIDYSAFADGAAVALPAPGMWSFTPGGFELPVRFYSEFALDDGGEDLLSFDAAMSSFAASVSTSTPSSAAPVIGQLVSGAFDFPEGANIEAGFSMLDLFNLAPFAGLDQSNTVYMLDQGDSFSLARIEMSADITLNAGRDPFELTSYLIGDTDNDGVDDYVIRIDKGGPTLLGTDFII